MLKTLRLVTGDPASLSIGSIFGINSLLLGNWFARIPEVQNRSGLSEGELGLALLGAPLGSLLIIPVTSWLVDRQGSGKITFWAISCCCLAIVTPTLAWNQWSLGAAMLSLGIANGCVDIAMNPEAAAIENRRKIQIMSTFHA